MKSIETLAQLKSATSFAPLGDAVGNLTLGRGRVGQGTLAVPVHMALVENKIASGSLGVKECEKLASLFRIVATQKTPLLIYLDSAGAKVSEGLPALGAFRQMYRAAVEMALSGAPVVALLGANCYGGASMVAALAGLRVFSDNTQLAMSGPSILAQSAGASALDDAFRAIAAASIGVEGRAKVDSVNTREWHAVIPPMRSGPDALFALHQRLGERLSPAMRQANATAAAPSNRKDLAALFPQGYDAHEQDGVLSGSTKHVETGETIALLGLVDRAALGAARAWLLADRLWAMVRDVAPAKRLNIVVDCEAHSAKLDDEKVMLSAYIANLATALLALGKRGTYIETTVLGVLGGGVYVALAAASVNVNLLHGAHIQLLPRGAIASILGGEDAPAYQFGDYLSAQVAEQELRVGYLRQ